MIQLLKKLRQEKGFTLVEMAIVILIIAALLLIIIPNVGGVGKSVGNTTDDALENTIETQKILYEMDKETKGEATLENLLKDGYITQEQMDAYTSSNTD